MRRRDLLVGGMSVTGALLARSAYSQLVKRAAVVVGVDRVGDLTPLRGAASGAREVAAWLRAEGFEVKLFEDSQGPVTVNSLITAITELVRRGNLEQLVIYFAGHGFVSSYSSELWMLSDARSNYNEAISLNECRETSRQFGIKNVVFISDACRSRAETLQTGSVKGSIIFPPPQSGRGGVATEVDKFLATRIGDPAWEISVAATSKASQGIYTACLLEAFRRPYNDMVQLVDGTPVVPNRRLKGYLANEVPKRAQTVSIQLSQTPDAEVCSDEPTYIGHVSTADRQSAGAPKLTLADVASSAVGTELAGGRTQDIGYASQDGEARLLYDVASATIAQARGLPVQLSSRAGFVVSGQHVQSITMTPGVATSVQNMLVEQRPSALVDVDVSKMRAASAALRFADGSGTVIAALDNFVGSVIVDQGGVTNVSYVPSRQSPMRSIYESQANQLEQLRAAVATAARFGVFRIEGPRSVRNQTAAQFAGKIRMLKGIDPTLGLYAAYAYADADLIDQVRSVRNYMRGDLGADLFDVVMLTGDLSRKAPGNAQGPYPFCPMLSQGWGLLRVRAVRLPGDLADLREHLRPSLWTSIDLEGMRIVETALRSGRVR